MANFGAFKLIFEKCIHISSLAATSSPPHPYEREQNMGHVLSIKFIVFLLKNTKLSWAVQLKSTLISEC